MDVDRARETIAAEKPRRLRLDELLRDLGADDTVPPEPASAKAAAETLADGSAATPVRPEGVTVGELVDRAAEAGFGFLIGVLALIAIPFFGLSTPFGLAIALIGAQLAIGKQRPWLPKSARRRHLSMAMLDRVLRLFSKRLRWLAYSTRRRYEVVITPKWIGLAITLLGLGLALPLPIPGSNMIFLIPIMIYSIALLERDGIWTVIGHVGTLIDIGLLFAFGATVVAVLERAWHWIT
ncbi:MAG TPA: exopolysaccharide biosynthesis protein [Kofleriaceae bacterium]|nr:exopolysaccharide biosynthesis protein [Kofleriaceae bacterium]